MALSDGAVQDKMLTKHSNKVTNEDGEFIAEDILPAVFERESTGKIARYGNGHLRIVNTVHQGKGNYNQIEAVTYSTDSYEILDHGLFDIVTARQMKNAQTPFDAMLDVTDALISLQQLAKEKALADTLTDGVTITQGVTLTGNNQYDNLTHADSTVTADRITAFGTVEDAIGVTPNVAIMNKKVFRNLRHHADLLDALGFKFNRKNGLSRQELADALEVDKILIGGAIYNTAKEGQTDAFSPVWGNHLIYAHISGTGKRKTTLGVEVRFNGNKPRSVSKFAPAMPVKSRGIIVTDEYDQLILDATTAYLIQDAIG